MARQGFLVIVTFLSSLVSHALSAATPRAVIYGAEPVNRSVVVAPFTSQVNSLDGAKLGAVNSTVYEWWYFDAVTSDLQTSVEIIFFAATENAFPPLGPSPSVVSVDVHVNYPNGSSSEYFLPADEARVQFGGPLGNGVAGDWIGAKSSFSGTADLSAFAVSFDFTEVYGVKGDFLFQSRAPAHYPCSASLAPGQDLEVLPGLGWTNAMPGANVSGVLYATDGDDKVTTHKFTNGSTGYHDMNWGAIPFVESENGWWWGRASVGPYAVVFWHGDTLQDKPVGLGYIADTSSGKIITSNCVANQTTVTPTWHGPKHNQTLRSIDVVVHVPDSHDTLQLTIQAEVTALYAPGEYGRWVGSVSGGMQGGKQYHDGQAIFENFPPQSKSG